MSTLAERVAAYVQSEHFGERPLDAQRPLDQQEFDSLDTVELVMWAEEEFNLTIADDILSQGMTVGEIARILEGLGAK